MKQALATAMIIAIWFLMPISGKGANLNSVVEFMENGSIDWTAGVVEAKGVGIPATYAYHPRSSTLQNEILADARNKAGHNLLETLVSLRINSQSRVIDVVENYPSLMIQLKNMAHKAPEIERLRKYSYDGALEVWSQMNLSGGFSQLFLPPEIRQIEPIRQVPNSDNHVKPRTSLRMAEIFSGMVVDARGIQAIPVLAPKILDENLEEVFGPAHISREFAVQRGLVRYITSLDKAKSHPRVADNPLIVKALKALEPGRCDFVISNADAAKVRSSSEHLLFMRECRVLIVLDAIQ